MDPLTGREQEVLEGVAKGQSYTEIAAVLGISSRTVEAYVSRIDGKLPATAPGSTRYTRVLIWARKVVDVDDWLD